MNGMQGRLAEVLDAHFDSRWGSPWWIARAASGAIPPLHDLVTVEDLKLLGAFPLEVLASHPVTDFIPRRFHRELSRFVSSETGGTTGPPKRTAFLHEEFHAGFVAPFLAAAELMSFPRDLNWLFIGPSGPHIIGKAAQACAKAMGSIDPFMVDFDPRWVRKLPPDSLARTRYVEHVVEQAVQVLRTQEVGVLFATPPVLEVLASRFSEAERASIRGIHLGGMRVSAEFLLRLRVEYFPSAVAMSGYGNSLMGLCPQVAVEGGAPSYFAHGCRMVAGLLPQIDDGPAPVCYHRLDLSMFLPNVIERDIATRCIAPDSAVKSGFHTVGLHDPHPPASAAEWATGLY